MPDIATAPFLLVEDDDQSALTLRETLEELGCANPLFRVPSPEEAANYLAGRGCFSNRAEFPLPDVVLLDIAARGLLRFIRNEPDISHLFVIVLRAGEGTTVLPPGADSYLADPEDRSEVAEVLELLRKHWPMVERVMEFRRESAESGGR